MIVPLPKIIHSDYFSFLEKNVQIERASILRIFVSNFKRKPTKS